MAKNNDSGRFYLTENQRQYIDENEVDDVSNRNVCTRHNSSHKFSLETWDFYGTVTEYYRIVSTVVKNVSYLKL